jgi:uncharacterized protein YidB (DUF937 family)
MGLLDGLLGNVLGAAFGGNQQQNPLGGLLGGLSGGGGGGNALLQIGLTLLQQNGGLEGVLGKFRQAGMGAQADSWVSTGPNMNISTDQLQQALGSGALGDIAAKLGMSQDQTGSALSQMLPELINQLTPQGAVTEESNNSIAEGLAALANSFGR